MFTCCHRRTRAFAAVALIAMVGLVSLAALPRWVEAQNVEDGIKRVALATGVQETTRFAGTLTLPLSRERAQVLGISSKAMHVTLGDWFLSDRSPEIKVPAQAFLYVAELRTGDVTTSIDGQVVPRSTGAIWVVPAGQTMTVKLGAHGQNAGLRILTLGKR